MHPTDNMPTMHFHTGCGLCGKQSQCWPAEDEDSLFLTTPREMIDYAAAAVSHTMREHGGQLASAGCFDQGISDDEFIRRVAVVKAAYGNRPTIQDVLRRLFPWLP